MAPSLAPLPIDPLLPELVAALEGGCGAVVLEAPPGAGKTTRVPRALLAAPFAQAGEILILQPRRLPARLAAERVAFELGEPVGARVGYTVRFEEVGGAGTRVRFITEGILLRRLLRDPTLRGVSAVVLDEFHERHLASDLALALLRQLRATQRPDLRLCVMSATLQAGPITAFLGDCPVLRSEGRRFDVALDYLAQPDERRLDEQVVAAVRRATVDGDDRGDVLVFLPGAAEIRWTAAALTPVAERQGWLVLPLHGDLSPTEQNRAVRPAERRKVILSTNVAETSVTIDGVTVVIDTGVARMASHSPWTGLPTLKLAKISQASAIQRAGRAGRTQPGRALRLYTRHDFDTRRPYDPPEVERLDLAEPLLTLAALGVRAPAQWGWFERPPDASLQAATELLRRLDALDMDGHLTETGRELLRFPTHPRLARLIVEGERRGVGEQAATLAALIGERDLAERAPFAAGPRGVTSVDLLEQLDAFEQARASRFSAGRLRGLGLDPRGTEAVERARQQLAREVRRPDRRAAIGTEKHQASDAIDQALALTTLAALPDRVAKRRGGPVATEVVLANGGAAAIGPTPPGEWLVAVEVEERAGGGAGARAGATVRRAVAISAEALLEVRPDEVLAEELLVFAPATERVEEISRLTYGALVLEESRTVAPPSDRAANLLAQAALDAGAQQFLRPGALDELTSRLALLGEHFPDAGVPTLGDSGQSGRGLDDVIAAASRGRISFAQLRQADLEAEWLGQLSGALRELLRRETPTKVQLPSGRELKVHYEADRPPWIESRLQDFFGMAQGPSICRGRVPLTLQLLAPNQRPVQVTRDLQSFWRQHYPALRRELGRRYPRHDWPEDGATATPSAPRPRRT